MRQPDLGAAASALGLLALGLVWLIALVPMSLLLAAAHLRHALRRKTSTIG